MKFVSTNHQSPAVSYEDAIFIGLAPDGGLYVPESIPQFTKSEIDALPTMSLHDIAVVTLHKWLGDELSKADIEEIVKCSISFPIPLVEVGGYKVLELFHGPTFSFKDLPAKILTHTIRIFNRKHNKKNINVLLASDGHTGSAVANGFADIDNSKVVVLYAKDELSDLKKELLTRIGRNVLAIEVNGSYKQCHSLIKQAFGDANLAKLGITAANSISVGRLLPQLIYYVYTYAITSPKLTSLVVSTDNFGNAYTALIAKMMGLPFDKIVLATNNNDFLLKYCKTGSYDRHSLLGDKNMPNNFPRVMHLCGYSHKKFLELFDVYNVSVVKAAHLMHAIWHEHKYLVDPHTAIAWLVADSLDSKSKNIVIVSIASPLKYVEEISKHVGIKVDDKELLTKLRKQKAKVIPMEANYDDFKALLLKEFIQ